MRASRQYPPGVAALRASGHALLVGVPIVVGVALVSLALAYGNNIQMGIGIALLGVGLGTETVHNLFF
jgi:hypothetical protein